MKNVLLFATLLFPLSVGAQSPHVDLSRSEISAYGTFGISTINYRSDFATPSMGLGGEAGLGYTFRWDKNWGLTTGLGMACYQAKATIDRLQTDILASKDVIPNTNDTYYTVWQTQQTQYSERQHALTLNIPIAVRFETDGRHVFYASLGAKLAIPLSAKYSNQTQWSNQTLSYAPGSSTPVVANDQNDYWGTGSYQTQSQGALRFNVSVLGTVEAGMRWRLSPQTSLYTGFYFDYGLTSLKSGSTDIQVERMTVPDKFDRRTDPQDFVFYALSQGSETDYKARFTTNSALASNYTTMDRQTVQMVKQANLMAFGVKIGVGFTFKKRAKATREAAYTEAPAAVVPVPVATPIPETQPAPEPIQEIPELAQIEAQAPAPLVEQQAPQAPEWIPEINGFPINQAQLTEEHRKLLMQNVAYANYFPDKKFTVVGHTCDLGTEAYNQQMGLRRATTAKEFMVTQGIAPERITIASKGETQPKVSNTSDANRLLNRRVMLTAE